MQSWPLVFISGLDEVCLQMQFVPATKDKVEDCYVGLVALAIIQLSSEVRLQSLKSQNWLLADFVLTVHTVITFKTIPVVPTRGVAPGREQSQPGIRQSDINYWVEFVLTI